MTESAAVAIQLPIEEVHEFLSNPLNDPQWCPTVTSGEQTAGQGPAPGAGYRFLHKPGPARAAPLTVEITELEVPHRFRARSSDAQGHYEYEYELARGDQGTTVVHKTESHFTSPLRFLAPLLKRHLAKVMEKQLRNLKRLLEADPGASRTGGG